MRWVAIAVFALGLALGARAQEAGSGWLGVDLQDVTKEEADALGWEGARGTKVEKVIPQSPAEAAGLKPDDVLLSLDGVEIENKKDFIEKVSKKPAGAEIRLAILRDKREKRLAVKLGARPAEFAAAKPKADAPLPMLDTGGHMAKIKAVAFTPDGRQLVSASEDKLIRVWDVATGKTVRAIRGEAGVGAAGKIYAMALSPDGKWLAAGGWMKIPGQKGHHIRLYDFASGRLVALLKGHENVVLSLAFSPDGARLISGSGDKTAIVWDVLTLRQAQGEVEGKPWRRLKGHADDIYAVGFTPDGARAVTGAFDNDLRLWRVADGAEIARMAGHGGKVQSLAVARDGTVASGDRAGEIRLWDGKTGRLLRTLARQGTAVGSLSFSPDGKKLLSSCGQGHPCEDRVFDLASGRILTTHKIDNDIVLATAISPDGRWAATGGGHNNEIHLWDLASGARRNGPDGAPLALAGAGQPVWAAGFSADGREIAWGSLWTQHDPMRGYGPLQFAMRLPSADETLSQPLALDPSRRGSAAPQGEGQDEQPYTREARGAVLEPHPEEGRRPVSKDEGWVRAKAGYGAWSLSRRKGGAYGYDAILDIKQGERVAASIERGPTDGYAHRSYTLTPDGETIISGGGNGLLTAYDRAGKSIGNFVGHEGDVWAVAVSPDGKYLVSGAADQTVRLWNVQTRELLVTIFRGADGEWVAWTPQGFFASSGPGAEMIGWQINHGPEHEAEYVTAAQLRQHLNRPDIVARAIQLASTEAAVKEARGADFTVADLLARPVPRLRILSPEADATARGGYAEVKVELQPTPDPVKLIRIQVNGRQIRELQPDSGAAGFTGRHTFTVPLAKGANKIVIAAVNDTGETVASVNVTHEGEGALDKLGVLYILAIGVDDYKGLGETCGEDGKQSCDLNFAGADAKAFADAMEKDSGPLHERVVKRVLVNGSGDGDAPTTANILNALSRLRRTAKENDTVMLFVSGHGVNDGPNYRFVPTDAAWGDGERLQPATAVSWWAFQEALTGASGRRILFLDTCHSGNAFNQKIIGDSYQANIVVYSSARWDQEAQEDPALGGGHGLFTFALVEGVDGKARDPAGEVRAEGLKAFLQGRVKELAAKVDREQEPQYFRARDAENVLLARAH